MAHAATQPTPISSTAGNTGKTIKTTTPVVPVTTMGPNREKALQILSKSIYKELRENGYQPKQIVALATEIISLVTTDIGHGSMV